MTAILEINDFELTLHRGSERLYHAPAVAIVREGELRFGEVALRQLRLFPQQANQQYLAKLNGDPINQPVQLAANQADLVYLHLKELRALCSDELVLAVPGTLSPDQLGVLLGICQEVGFSVAGFVDSAVAATASARVPASVVHIDLHLQQTVLTMLEVNQEVRRERATEIRECGSATLMDGWVNLIADRFVHETRFDPLHSADSEQQLYNQVYDWLTGAHFQSEVGIEVAHADQLRRVELARSAMEEKAQQRFRPVMEALPHSATVVLSARTSRVPGFAQTLKQAGHSVEVLGADAVVEGCSDNLREIIGTDLRLITRLPHRHGVQAPPVAPVPVSHGGATHFLRGYRALPLDQHPTIQVVAESGGWSLVGGPAIQLNGSQVNGTTRLSPGDSINDGTETVTAIRVDG